MVDTSWAVTVVDGLRQRHQNDPEQLDAVLSNDSRLLIQGPAGFGKTKVMVARMTKMLATGVVPIPKAILLLTFSVNAAAKAKQELISQIGGRESPLNRALGIVNRVRVTNYHGFCRQVLRRHGHLLFKGLKHIDEMKVIADEKIRNDPLTSNSMAEFEFSIILGFSRSVRLVDDVGAFSFLSGFVDLVISKLLPIQLLSHNAVIALTLVLFDRYPTVLNFYQGYFPAIFIDEFQDTNLLGMWLIQRLVGVKTKVFAYGDRLQRIFGFIGAVPKIFDWFEAEYAPRRISLSKNYRFQSNPNMLQLDRNIREIAQNPRSFRLSGPAQIPLYSFEEQREEADFVSQWICGIQLICPDVNIAVLVKQRGTNVDAIVEAIERKGVEYFWGLFGEDDSEYVGFHNECAAALSRLSGGAKAIGRATARKHYLEVSRFLGSQASRTQRSLLLLLGVFWKYSLEPSTLLSPEDRFSYAFEVFEHRTLRHFLELTGSRVTVSTIHGAKGLEWDFVLLPDMEQDLLPNYNSLCKLCKNKSNCSLSIDDSNESPFLDELSVFYVGVTRAKRQVTLSYSAKQLDYYGNMRSKHRTCFLSLASISALEGA